MSLRLDDNKMSINAKFLFLRGDFESVRLAAESDCAYGRNSKTIA